MKNNYHKIILSFILIIFFVTGCAQPGKKVKGFKHDTPLIKTDVKKIGKAEIEKDLNKETKDLDRKYKQSQIDLAEQKLGSGFEDDLRVLIAGSKDKVNKKQLERFARLTADKYGDTFTLVEDATVIGNEPGVYMVEDKIFRVDENGQAKQIV